MKPSAVSAPDAPNKSRVLRVRRLVLLATTIASLGAAAVVISPNFNQLQGGYPTALAQNLSEQARQMQAPVGFADIVEKVKPAVISVRVKVDGGAQTSGLGSNDVPPGLREFFRRFGMPDVPDGQRDASRTWPECHHRPGFRLHHFGGRLCRNQQSRRGEGRKRSSHDG